MSIETANVTWQKVAVLATIMLVLMPTVGRFAWGVVFPPDYLLYELSEPIQGQGVVTAAVTVTNAGNKVQESIVVSVPRQLGGSAWFDVGVPRQSHLGMENSEPRTALAPEGKMYQVAIGKLLPEESVRVSLLASGKKNDEQPVWSLYGVRVQSATTLAVQADGIKHPSFDGTLHGTYRDGSPLMLAALLLMLALIWVVASSYAVFFDTDEQRVARLWKQMDEIQERIFKAKWRR